VERIEADEGLDSGARGGVGSPVCNESKEEADVDPVIVSDVVVSGVEKTVLSLPVSSVSSILEGRTAIVIPVVGFVPTLDVG
jgi:hypothetical protein